MVIDVQICVMGSNGFGLNSGKVYSLSALPKLLEIAIAEMDFTKLGDLSMLIINAAPIAAAPPEKYDA